MPYPSVRSARPLPFLAPLLVAALLAPAALFHHSAPQPTLTHAPAPAWLAGDNDKGGVGVG